MSRVPSSYATLVADISAEEEFNDHRVKSDGAVVSMVASVTSTEERGYADSADPEVVGQVSGSDQYERTDAATVSMVGVVSGIDGKTWVDAATVTMLSVAVAGDDVHNFTYTDAATVSMAAVASGTDIHSITEITSKIKVIASITALDEHNYPADAANVVMAGVVSGLDLVAKWYTDLDTVTEAIGDAGNHDTFQARDAATAITAGVVSADDTYGRTDAAVVSMVGIPSGIDGKEWSDLATVSLTGIPSALDAREWSDADTVILEGVPSGTDELVLEDATTVILSGVVSGVEEYTQPPAHANETYIFAWGSSADGTSDQGDGGDAGGGSTWNLEKVSASRAGMGASTDENAHDITDLPVRYQDYIFFGAAPTNGYGYFFAIGDAGSVGVKTTTAAANPPVNTGTSATATTAGYTIPDTPTIGDLVLVFASVRGSQTAATPTDSSGETYTLVYSGTSPGGVTNYLWSRVALANDGAFVISSVLSGSADWYIGAIILNTPSSTTVYKMYEGAMVTGGSIRNTLTAATHQP